MPGSRSSTKPKSGSWPSSTIREALLTVTAGAVDRLQLWDAVTGRVLSNAVECPEGINSLAVHPKGNWIATAHGDSTAKIWELRGLSLRRDGKISKPPELTLTNIVLRHDGKVLSVAFSPGGDYLIQAARTRLRESGTGGKENRPASLYSIAEG